MSDRELQIGGTVRSVFTEWEVAIDSELRLWWAKEKVRQGSFEIVDPQPQEEPGPAADTATTREGAK